MKYDYGETPLLHLCWETWRTVWDILSRSPHQSRVHVNFTCYMMRWYMTGLLLVYLLHMYISSYSRRQIWYWKGLLKFIRSVNSLTLIFVNLGGATKADGGEKKCTQCCSGASSSQEKLRRKLTSRLRCDKKPAKDSVKCKNCDTLHGHENG